MIRVAFEDTAVNRSKVYERYNRFTNGRTSIEDDPRPSTSTTEIIKQEIDALVQKIDESQ